MNFYPIFFMLMNLNSLSFSKLPYWIQGLIPRIFYIYEKAWNYYPFTITEYTVGIYLVLSKIH